jgi:RNA polymerase sigma-70 factor (ECF subfamily)
MAEADAPLVEADHDEEFKAQMVALIPRLRAFARGLCRDADLGDDIAQEAMMRAWSSRDTFRPGSNFRAWMFMIVRNHFYTTAAKRSLTVVWDPEAAERLLVQAPTQEDGLHLDDVNRAMARLPDKQREMLLLIAGAGVSYEEASEIAGCSMGTVKSRLNRARIAIRELIDHNQPLDGLQQVRVD